MAAKEEINVAQLFLEVSKKFKDGDYAIAQKSANKILKALPNDVDALKCKIVCLLQQSCFREAIDGILSAEKKGLFCMDFEKGYCLYRLNKLDEAEDVLKAIKTPSMKEKDLLAQVQYRLEDYKGCMDLYRDLIKNSDDDYGDEREANMAAVIAASKMWKDTNLGDAHVRTDTYELCYNYACLLIAQGNLEKASEMLIESEKLCRKSLEADEDITEEEIEEELDVMRAQQAYIQQLQNKTSDALTMYNKVLKNKPTDIALTAVISNNIVAVHKDKDLFDSKKRLKPMSAEGLEHKLTKKQLQIIETNKCLLYMYTNQMANCKKSIEILKENTGGSSSNKTALLEAAIFLWDKHHDLALEHLQKILESGENSNNVILTLAQLSLSKGLIEAAKRLTQILNERETKKRKHENAINLLQKLTNIKYSPAVVSLCVSLHNILGQREKASQYLDEAIEYCKKNEKQVKKEHLITFMRESSNLKLSCGEIEDGVKMLENLRKEDPSELSTLAKIVAAYSKIDLNKAKEYSVDLPELSTESEKDLDLDILEMTEMIGSFRFSKKRKGSIDEGESKEEVVIKRKKRKHKKGKLPKNYNPEVDPDPERWLPRWERSTYKHKKSKRGNAGIGKGTQGAVGGGGDQPAASPKSGSAAASPKPSPAPSAASPGGQNVVPPRQQKPGSKSKGKKKKKSGW